MKKIKNWIFVLMLSFVITSLINMFVFQTYRVEGHSMDPTLHNKEKLFVSKIVNTLSIEPDYDDIVIIDSRLGEEETFKDKFMNLGLITAITGDKSMNIYVKRVIGKPGDSIEIKEGKLYRNNKLMNEPYINEPMNKFIDEKWVVPKDHLFVMGDNRNYSRDSRDIGYIPLKHVLGKVMI